MKKADHDVNIGNVINHKDRITRLSWETINSQLYLVTGSLDGHLFFFKIVPSIGSVVITERYGFLAVLIQLYEICLEMNDNIGAKYIRSNCRLMMCSILQNVPKNAN